MDNAPFPWKEEIPVGTRSNAACVKAVDQSNSTMTIKVTPENVFPAIGYITGYSQVGGNPPTVVGNSPTYFLDREPPARHPRWKWERATKILNVVGKGGPGEQTVVAGGNGLTGDYTWYYITIQFEQPTYSMLTNAVTNAEYQRWTTKLYKPNLETLARRNNVDGPWTFYGVPGLPNQQYPGDIYLRQPKATLEWTWFDVPEAWTHLGNLIPTNIQRCVGTLNNRVFPYNSFGVNQNLTVAEQALVPARVQFPPGTLLMLEPEARIRTQSAIEIVNFNSTPPNFFPRAYDWVFRWIYFDPPYNPASFLLVNPGGTISPFYGAVPGVDYGPGTGNPGEQIIVRGHNLLPTPKAYAGYNWYPAIRGQPGNVAGTSGGPLPSNGGVLLDDLYLQYPYADHETIFEFAN